MPESINVGTLRLEDKKPCNVMNPLSSCPSCHLPKVHLAAARNLNSSASLTIVDCEKKESVFLSSQPSFVRQKKKKKRKKKPVCSLSMLVSKVTDPGLARLTVGRPRGLVTIALMRFDESMTGKIMMHDPVASTVLFCIHSLFSFYYIVLNTALRAACIFKLHFSQVSHIFLHVPL
jgi:hypothetical protein